MSNSQPIKLIVAITDPSSVILLKGQLNYFRELNYDVVLITSPGKIAEEFCVQEEVRYLPVLMSREINLLKDIQSLFKLIKIIREEKPSIVNAGTPKSGLLVMIAAYLLRVENRIYTCRGLRYEHEKGIRKFILRQTEWLAGSLSTATICISPSLKNQALKDHLFKSHKTRVLLKGSSNGIDLERFRKTESLIQKSISIKRRLNLENKFVLGFIGRLIERKGIRELLTAYKEVKEKHNEMALVIVGAMEQNQLSSDLVDIINEVNGKNDIHWLGFHEDIPKYLSIMDLFVLPAWWEGFGNVLIQAATMEIPVISTMATGCKDAVKDGFNGTLIEPKNVSQLKMAILRYYNNPRLLKEHGKNGPIWSLKFDSRLIWEELKKIYEDGIFSN